MLEDFCKVKSNLKNLLYGTSVCCCICLKSVRNAFFKLNFVDIDKETEAGTVEGMMLQLFSTEDLRNLISKYICDHCQENLKQAYTFVAGVKNTAKIINSYLDQMDEQIDTVYTQVESTGNFVNTVLSIENYIQKPEKSFINEVCNGDNTFDDTHEISENSEEPADISGTLNSNILICDMCGQSFQYRSAIIYHIANMHPERKFSSRMTRIKRACSECPTRPCVHEKYLKAAFSQQKLGLKGYKCIDCHHFTTKKTHLISHVNRRHLNINPHLCEICGSAFPSARMHQVHLKQHYLNSICCQYCDLHIKQNSATQHTENCSKIQRPHKCDSCPASFNDAKSLKTHERKRHKQTHTCSICLATFSQLTCLWKHKRDFHGQGKRKESSSKKTDISRKKCDFCFKQCNTWIELKNHLSREHANEKYKCHICKKTFTERKKYKMHLKSAPHLMKENPNVLLSFKCDKCQFSCVSALMLENHMNLVHLDIKPYICNICAKEFTTNYHLKVHLQGHVGTRKYHCTICSATVKALSSLKKHMIRHEKPENWPYACELCEKRFVCASDRVFHTKQVHGGKDEPCPICKACFHTKRSIRNHVSQVHVKGKAPQVAEFLKANKHNKELMELYRDRRKPRVDNSANFSLTVISKRDYDMVD